MDINGWLRVIEQALIEKEIEFTPELKTHLLSAYSETSKYSQENMTKEVLEAIHEFFYTKFSRGETFGELSRIKERFGETVEGNYGLWDGPFIDMAKTYWTYKLELKDLNSTHPELILSALLNDVELLIADVFFPTPGPLQTPVKKRKEKQRKILEKLTPDIDIDRFLDESPILHKGIGERMKIVFSEELKQYCYDKIHELAKAYNDALLSRLEYETAFSAVMSVLHVPEYEQKNILEDTQHIAELDGIPYHRLSPLNQYVTAVGPYLAYCLRHHPPINLERDEIERLIHDGEFNQYVEQLGIQISQKVKGALWKPGYGCLGKTAMFFLLILVSVVSIIFIFYN
ncbi:hypothetical protein ACFLRM_05255 [Acidobacteriota bacterium]